MNKKFVVVFSNSNYCTSTGGTEKFIKNLSKLYQSQNIDFINFFATLYSEDICGLNINDKYSGIYDLNSISGIVSNLCKNNSCIGILIQHVKGFNLKTLADQLCELNMDIIMEIHDFYFICNTFNFLKNKKDFCGITKPCEEKCIDCHNYKSLLKFKADKQYFFTKINSLITKIIFPSEYCMKTWLSFFSQYKDISYVRPNLTISGNYNKQYNNKKLKLAYIGRKSIHKGVDTWNNLVLNSDINKNFDLYYFGIDLDNTSNITEVYTNGNMQKQLRNNNIDIVLLWSIIPETYSYAYYEASSSGAVILCNNLSGNICSEVNKNDNGYIFNNDNELTEFLKNNYQYNNIKKSKYSPLNIYDNDSLDIFRFNNDNYYYHSKSKIHKKKLLSLIYKIIKYKKLKVGSDVI